MTRIGVLTALDLNGKQIWQRDLQTDYGQFGLLWGYATS